jgi:hypothetical protein
MLPIGASHHLARSTSFILISALALAACADKPPVSEFCAVARPIPNSQRNHEATKVAVDEHNLVGVRLCKW